MSDSREKFLRRWGAFSGFFAPILFASLSGTGANLTTGYNQLSQTISELGAVGQPYALLQDANFVATGLLIIIFTPVLYRNVARSRASTIGAILLLAYPVAFVLVGTLFPLPSPVHVPLGSLGFFVTLVGLTITSFPMRRDSWWKMFGSYTLVTGIASIAGFFVYGFLQSQGTWTAWLGLIQRLELAPYFLWVAIAGFKLAAKGR